MSLIDRTFRILGGLVVGGVLVGLLFLLWIVFRVWIYEQSDDEVHLAAKQDYLERIESRPANQTNANPPNIVLILFDDLGFGDLGSYGAQSIATPHIDELARKGLRLDNYYAPSSVCTSSRAAMLTGRYAPRAALNIVAFPTGHPIESGMRAAGTPVRLPAEEILLPEILKAAGYDTGMVGKWHLGDHAPSLPNDRGFDHYLGALYSNDMSPFAIYRNDAILHEAPFDQRQLTPLYTAAAVDFLERDRDAPFFFYYAHNFPHIPLFTPEADVGRSRAGLYGDVVEGLDDSVGEILEVLERKRQLENTLILVTSDNGPWYEGSPGASRGRKNQTWEGGMRVPFIAFWSGRIAEGRTSAAPVVGVDLVPTVLSLLGLPAPEDRMLDGIDVRALLLGESGVAEASVGEAGVGEAGLAASGISDEGQGQPESLDRRVYYFGDGLDAVRDGRFKYHRRRGVRSTDLGDSGSMMAPQGPWLFDLELDPAESYDVTRRYPEVAARMAKLFDAKVEEMRENPRGWQ